MVRVENQGKYGAESQNFGESEKRRIRLPYPIIALVMIVTSAAYGANERWQILDRILNNDDGVEVGSDDFDDRFEQLSVGAMGVSVEIGEGDELTHIIIKTDGLERDLDPVEMGELFEDLCEEGFGVDVELTIKDQRNERTQIGNPVKVVVPGALFGSGWSASKRFFEQLWGVDNLPSDGAAAEKWFILNKVSWLGNTLFGGHCKTGEELLDE